MSAYAPPTQNLPVFEPEVFGISFDVGLTITSGEKYFVKYPVAQGTTTFPQLKIASAKIALGSGAGLVQGTDSVAIGNGAGANQGLNCVAIGAQAGLIQTGAAIAIGHNAGGANQGTSSISIGHNSVGSGTNSISIGDGATTSTFNSSVAIGDVATATANNQITLGTTSSIYRFSGMYANNLISYRVADAGYSIAASGTFVLKYETVTNAGNCGVTYDTGTGIFTNNNSYTVLCNIAYNNLWDGTATSTGGRVTQLYLGTTSGGAPSTSIAYMYHSIPAIISTTVVNICSMNIAIPAGFKFGIYCSQGQGSAVLVKSFSGANPSYVTVMVF